MSFTFPVVKVVETSSKKLLSNASSLVRPVSPRAPRTPRTLTPRRSLVSTPKADFSTLIVSPSATPRSMSLSLGGHQLELDTTNASKSPSLHKSPMSFSFPVEDTGPISPIQKTYLDHLEDMRSQNAFPKKPRVTSPRATSVKKHIMGPTSSPPMSPSSVEMSPRPMSVSRGGSASSPRRLVSGIGGIVKNKGPNRAASPTGPNSTQKRRKSMAVPGSFSFPVNDSGGITAGRMSYLDHLESIRSEDPRAIGMDYQDILSKMRTGGPLSLQ